jgi:hypothetical protein
MITSLLLQLPSTLATFHFFGIILLGYSFYETEHIVSCFLLFPLRNTLHLPSRFYGSNLPKELNLHFIAVSLADTILYDMTRFN